MSKRQTALFHSLFLLLLLAPMSGSAQSDRQQEYQPALTSWGHPDLQGVWDRRTITPLQRPERFANKAYLNADEIAAYERASAARDDGRPLDYGRSGISVHDPDDLDYGDSVLPTGQTSLVVDPPDGLIPPLTEAARARAAERATYRASRGPADSWTDRSLTERCLTWGVPQGMLPQAYNNNIQILQTPNEVLILNEMIHDIRIVPLDNKPHLPSKVRQWHGDPRGHWRGNTLVIESTNFSSKSSFRGSSENLYLEERFTRIGDGQLLYEFTVEDPSTWERPWSVSFPMAKSDQPIYEFACHEGNHGLYNILSVARNLEKQAMESQVEQ
jgi:hypothetical protein